MLSIMTFFEDGRVLKIPLTTTFDNISNGTITTKLRYKVDHLGWKLKFCNAFFSHPISTFLLYIINYFQFLLDFIGDNAVCWQ